MKVLDSHRIRKNVQYLRRYWQVYALMVPAVIFVFIFSYVPIYGIQIAFKDFEFSKGILGSEFVGMEHFLRFFRNASFKKLLTNTLTLSVSSLIFGFPVPVLLALMLNELKNQKLKKTVQMITYLPHFLSLVAVCGMTILFTDKKYGIINLIIEMLGGESVSFMTKSSYFAPIYVITGIWQQMGWDSIIFVAALSGVDMAVLEAAKIDGANRLQKIWYVDIPHILPTVIILLILKAGTLLSVGYEKVLLLQNSMNLTKSDVISTYVYRLGIEGGQFSYTTAIGLFNSVVNVVILTLVNTLSRKLSDTSLW